MAIEGYVEEPAEEHMTEPESWFVRYLRAKLGHISGLQRIIYKNHGGKYEGTMWTDLKRQCERTTKGQVKGPQRAMKKGNKEPYKRIIRDHMKGPQRAKLKDHKGHEEKVTMGHVTAPQRTK